MLVPLLAIIAAFSFAGGNVSTRRATQWASSIHGVRISIFVGPPLFAIVAVILGEAGKLDELTVKALLLFATAGLVHFVFGRALIYEAISLIGAPRAVVVSNLSVVFSVVTAVIFLGEDITWFFALGGVVVLAGTFLMTRERGYRSGPGAAAATAVISYEQIKRGIPLAVAGALLWGISPIFVKAGLDDTDLPVIATFVSYMAAAVFVGGALLLRPSDRAALAAVDSRARTWFIISGFCTSLAQLLRYLALDEGSVIQVVLIMQPGVPVFAFLLTLLLNRQIESFNRDTILGGLMIIAGTTLIVATG